MITKAENRREEIILTARKLFYHRGYEAVSIQEIIDTVGIAKGTFYHYFKSKEALLDALIKGMLDAMQPIINEVKARSEIPPIQRLQELFSTAKSWKGKHADLVLIMMKQLYRDENILLRRKLNSESSELVIPVICSLIQEGNQSGEMHCPYPGEFAAFMMDIAIGVSEKIVEKVQEMEENRDRREQLLEELDREFHAIDAAFERLLGLHEGDLTIYRDIVSENFIQLFMQGGSA